MYDGADERRVDEEDDNDVPETLLFVLLEAGADEEAGLDVV